MPGKKGRAINDRISGRRVYSESLGRPRKNTGDLTNCKCGHSAATHKANEPYNCETCNCKEWFQLGYKEDKPVTFARVKYGTMQRYADCEHCDSRLIQNKDKSWVHWATRNQEC